MVAVQVPVKVQGEDITGKWLSFADLAFQIDPQTGVLPGDLAHLGNDDRFRDDLMEVCQDADTLVIEATYLTSEAEMAADFAHLTAQQAARLASETGVKHLLLTHISRRYRERDVLTEARAVFANSVVARDMDIYQIKRGSCEKVDTV